MFFYGNCLKRQTTRSAEDKSISPPQLLPLDSAPWEIIIESKRKRPWLRKSHQNLKLLSVILRPAAETNVRSGEKSFGKYAVCIKEIGQLNDSGPITWRFNTANIKAHHHGIQSSTTSIHLRYSQSIAKNLFNIKFQSPDFYIGRFPTSLTNKILYEFLVSLTLAISSDPVLGFTILTIAGDLYESRRCSICNLTELAPNSPLALSSSNIFRFT